MKSLTLTLVDRENYVLDGILYKFPQMEAPMDLISAERAVAIYKQKLVDQGMSFGLLDNIIQESRQDDMPMDEFTDFIQQDPIDAVQALQWDSVVDEEEVVFPSQAAFQILDMMLDEDGKNIVGRIHVLDTTPQGIIARENIDKNMKCMITQAAVDEVVDRDRSIQNAWVMKHIVRKIKGGWRMSFEQNETVPSNKA